MSIEEDKKRISEIQDKYKDLYNPESFDDNQANTQMQENEIPAQKQAEQFRTEEGVVPTYKTETNSRPQVENIPTFCCYGGFWRRFVSSNLDYWPSLLVMILGAIASGAFLAIKNHNEPGPETLVFFGIMFLVYLINLIYNIILYFREGRTIGYKLLGMKIVSEKTGQSPENKALWIRGLVKFLPAFIPYLGALWNIVIGLMIAFNGKKQGPHDMAADTIVVLEKKKNTWLIWLTLSFPIIIGILAGILFAAIPKTEINVANQMILKTTMSQIPTQAIIRSGGDYSNVCEDLKSELDKIKSIKGVEVEHSCESNKDNFVFAIKKNNDYYCVDVFGYHNSKAKEGGLSCN